jgi:hypothetical protein
MQQTEEGKAKPSSGRKCSMKSVNMKGNGLENHQFLHHQAHHPFLGVCGEDNEWSQGSEPEAKAVCV